MSKLDKFKRKDKNSDNVWSSISDLMSGLMIVFLFTSVIFMSKVIDIHGQHENQLILNENEHIEYLDAFIEDKIQEKVEYKTLYQNYKSLQKELKENYGDDKEKERKQPLFLL